MMRLLNRKNISLSLSLLMTFIMIAVSLVSSETTAHAETNVNTFNELKDAISQGGTVNITNTITIPETIVITKDVILTCSHEDGSKEQDIVRDQEFHNHLFDVRNGATLTLRCCVSGNSKANDDDINFRGYGGDGVEASGFYGWALIKLTDGDLILDSDKSVLKNNYNPTTVDKSVWTYNETKYYAMVSIFTDVGKSGLSGSAIYALNGSVTMSDGEIYNCVADNGPALYFASGYETKQAEISGGSIYDNVARRYGGAIFSANRENNKITQNSVSSNGFNFTSTRTLNNDGSNARLTISGGTLYNNMSRLGGGAIWSGHGATLYISDGIIRNNICAESNGGAILTNAGDIESIASNSVLCLGLPGGQTWIAGGKIYDNNSLTNGGGIAATRIDLTTAKDYNEEIYYDNLFKITDGEIYNNQSRTEGGGIITATETSIKGGKIYGNTSNHGGGVYNTDESHVLVAGAEIYENTATYGGGIYNNGELTISGTANIHTNTANGAHGGGVYNLGILNMVEGSIYNNKTDAAGGGIYNSGENAHLNMTGGKIYDNAAGYAAGGIYIGTNVMVSEITGGEIYNNTAVSNTKDIGTGGGIYVSATNGLTISGEDVKIHGNMAENGGGIYTSVNISIKDGAEIYDNKAFVRIDEEKEFFKEGYTAGNGGGLYFIDTQGNKNSLELNGANIHNNYADYQGGGIANKGSVIVTGNTKIYKNEAWMGGGIYNDINVVVTGNVEIYDNMVNKHEEYADIITSSICGGGITNNGYARLTINENVSIYSNEAVDGLGGGIYSNGYCTTDISDDVKIYKNEALSGGGINNGGEFNLSGNVQIYKNNATASGGGITTGSISESRDFTMTGGEIYENTALEGAGVFLGTGCKTNQFLGGLIHGNIATKNGGGIRIGNKTVGAIIDNGFEIYENKAFGEIGSSGGGIYITLGTLDIKNANIYKNEATHDGGAIWSSGEITIEDGEIYENQSKLGSGIANHGTLTVLDVDIYNNTANTQGGGIRNGGTLNFEGGLIHDNAVVNSTSNKALGGGIYNTGAKAILNVTGGEIYNNNAFNGAGVYLEATVPASTISNAKIYNNTYEVDGIKKGGNGFGIYTLSTAGLTINDTEIYGNIGQGFAESTVKDEKTASGGGIFIGTNGVLSMNGGSIKKNNANTGNGVYLKTKGTFKMLGTAIVESDNIVYLEKDAYITVPTEFTGNKDIRAHVTGANMVTGRVIAKFGDNVDAEGTKALYWNTDTVKESEHYFVVEGKLLRAGDQGAAKDSGTVNNQDVFLSEVYSVDFDMNPSNKMLYSTIVHTIGEKDYVFSDLLNVTVNKNIYQKYWNEELSFDPGHAVYNFAVISGWSLADDRAVLFTPDETNVIAATINKNIVILAEWMTLIDVDYDGNGATIGENWTDEKVDIIEDYQVSDNDTAFTRKERTRQGNTRLYQFTGWSFEESAIAKDYAFGATIEADELRSYVLEMEDRERDVATIYAVWDEFPTIEAFDRWFTLDEAQKGEITLEELMKTATATDGIVGDRTNFKKPLTGTEEFTLIDFNEDDFKTFTTSGNATVTYKAVDAVGNEAYKTVIVHIVDKDEQKYDETTLYTRFISSDYFENVNGQPVEEHHGGLNENSKWLKDTEYNSLLSSTLSNSKNTSTGKWTTVSEKWDWSIDEIELCKIFVSTHGVGNIENPNALKDFYNQFGPDN